ncbi:hypothetical protein A7K50_08715 [Dehalobacter sp. MCB1]|uniref:AAA family ATPase n=1 Tax=unclassified Dehalobacter TaxID=2635733 RepID=UPI000E6CA95D|nr:MULTISPECIES: AAA family ATPase [unclassified Dehalobacter]RJE48819.1 hypothetical protein A7K50_08715 [Dehalobacter sp. MCB1]TCX53054.1 hypothetical protein C1I38_08350 [Dehalobacter sp. 12DCB1]
MTKTEKATARASSEATGEGQPLTLLSKKSISETGQNINPDFLSAVSMTELFDTVYPPRIQVIGSLLCSGVYLFAGAPKIGKSFFMAQLGYHVSSGLPLWEFPVHKGTTLYLALEDDYARLQKRLSRMFGIDSSDNFYLSTHAKNLKDGLDSQLDKFIQEHPETVLVIIDTLQKIREIGSEKYSYASDYEIVTRLKQFADRLRLCLILVHHTRKQEAGDCFDTISGTNGLLGAADGAFLMQKDKRNDNRAILDVVGRDQQDQRLHLLFDRERCIWQLTKAETELWQEPPDPILEAIADFLRIRDLQWHGSASELIAMLGLEIQPNVLTRRLNVGAERLWNEYNIRYESNRNHFGRTIKLTPERDEA